MWQKYHRLNNPKVLKIASNILFTFLVHINILFWTRVEKKTSNMNIFSVRILVLWRYGKCCQQCHLCLTLFISGHKLIQSISWLCYQFSDFGDFLNSLILNSSSPIFLSLRGNRNEKEPLIKGSLKEHYSDYFPFFFKTSDFNTEGNLFGLA